jgi:hypothetical protein
MERGEPRTQLQWLYESDPEAYTQRLRESSGDLFGAGYRVAPHHLAGVFSVSTPSGRKVLPDAYSGMCTCRFWHQHHLPCRHTEGLETLIVAQAQHLLDLRQWKELSALAAHWRVVRDKLSA